MRILYLSPWFPYPLDAGLRVRVYHLLRALARRHLVTLLGLEPQGWAPAQVDAIAPLCEHAAVVHQDPFSPGRWRTATRFFSLAPIVSAPIPALRRRVQQLHAEKPFDAVISASTAMSSYARQLPDVVRILEEHNSLTRWMQERYLSCAAPLRRLQYWSSWKKSQAYESYLFRRFHLITMVSEQDAQISRRLVPGQPAVAIVPNGVDCDQFHPGLAEPEPDTLIYSGGLAYAANLQAVRFFLQEIYPQIRRARPNVRLLITGPTGAADLSSLPLDASVTLTGFVEDIRPAISRAWVSVVPIRSGGGTRLKILEAMALGTPVVSTTKGAEGLEAVSGEQLFIADEPDHFARAVIELLSGSALRSRLAANARRQVQALYDWSQIGQRFCALVESAARPAFQAK